MRQPPSLGTGLAILAGLAVAAIGQSIMTMRRAASQRDRIHNSQEKIAAAEATESNEEAAVRPVPLPVRPRPHVRINTRPADDSYATVMGNLRLAPHQEAVEATLLAPDAAATGFGKQMMWVFGIVYVVVGGGLLAIALFAGSPMDRERFLPLVVILLIVWAVAMPLGYGYNMRKFRTRMDAINPPAPAGSTMRLDVSGLAITGRPIMAWSALTLDTVGFVKAVSRYDSFYVIDSLFLKNGDETIEIDRNAFTNGHVFLDNVFERLCPAD